HHRRSCLVVVLLRAAVMAEAGESPAHYERRTKRRSDVPPRNDPSVEDQMARGEDSEATLGAPIEGNMPEDPNWGPDNEEVEQEPPQAEGRPIRQVGHNFFQACSVICQTSIHMDVLFFTHNRRRLYEKTSSEKTADVHANGCLST